MKELFAYFVFWMGLFLLGWITIFVLGVKALDEDPKMTNVELAKGAVISSMIISSGIVLLIWGSKVLF